MPRRSCPLRACEAAEAVQAASLLMHILDRVEDRLLAAARQALDGRTA
jgi:hypothetical protein